MKRWERDTSAGSKVANTLPIFSRTDLLHLAVMMTYDSKSLEASLAAREFCASRSCSFIAALVRMIRKDFRDN